MIWPALGEALLAGRLYDPIVITEINGAQITTLWRYSPEAAWIMSVFGADRAFLVIAHLAALALLPRGLALIAMASWPFWVDTLFGNVFTFVFVAAVLALRGNRVAVLVFVALTMLMPPPVQLPLAAWLLWTQPWSRLPTLGMGLIHIVILGATGYMQPWVERLVETSTDEMVVWYNFGPTQFIGYWWFVVGVPLAAFLLWKGRPAWAGLAISPYILGQYWMFALTPRHREAPSPMKD